MKLPKAVKRALKLLEEAGYEAVVVGAQSATISWVKPPMITTSRRMRARKK